MLEMASLGAKVMQPASIQEARLNRIEIDVKSTFSKKSGTTITKFTHKEGMEQPVKYFVPSIAPGSLIVYSGKAFPAWKGNLFSGALAKRHGRAGGGQR